jgi:alpha-tubulin suppressor-like RCC1 family protein
MYSSATGILGSGADTTNSDAPRAVVGNRRFVTISAGTDHFCGLTNDSQAYCWGGNERGQLGDGTNTDSSKPSAPRGNNRFKSITTAHAYTCGISTDRGVLCWGNGRPNKPTVIRGGQGIVRLEATEEQLCGLTQVGRLLCADFSRFTVVDGAPKYADLAVGSGEVYSLCGLQKDGTVYCWGLASDPMMLVTDLRFKSLTQGGLNLPEEVQFSCGLTTTGIAYCWGSNNGGQLGNGTLDYSSDPVAVQ